MSITELVVVLCASGNGSRAYRDHSSSVAALWSLGSEAGRCYCGDNDVQAGSSASQSGSERNPQQALGTVYMMIYFKTVWKSKSACQQLVKNFWLFI